MNGHPVAGSLPVAAADNSADRLELLFDAHHDRLYRLARRLVPSTDDALDLVQETFLRAARSKRPVPFGISNEEAWLVRILVNIRRDQWRKAGVRKRYETDSERPAAVNRHDQEAAMIARTSVWKALDRLTPRRRAIVVMHELEALDVASIAELLSISAITVRWHLSVGRRELVQALKPHMGDSHESH